MPLPPEVLAMLARQDGLITHEQATSLGISESTIQRRVRAGDWLRPHPRVYLVGGHPCTDPVRVRGAGLWARSAALLTAAADRADSATERVILRILRTAGVTGWQLGLPFERWKIDLAFPDARIAVEIDSWAWHVDLERFRADRHKGNALVRAGGPSCASRGTT